jgi:hypothetical protein
VAKHKKDKRQDQNLQSARKSRPFSFPFAQKHPDWAAWCILFLLLVIFFSPLLFSNKTLLPPDKIASLSYKNFVPQTIPDAVKRHYYPLWNPYLFGGMPSFASMTMPFIDIVNNVILLAAGAVQWLIHGIAPVDLKSFFMVVLNYLLMGGCLYLLLRDRSLSFSASLFGAAALVFTPQIMAYVAFGHNTKLATAAFIPLVFLLTLRLLEKRDLLHFCLLGLGLGIQFLRAHVQISYYTHLMIGLYFIYWTVCAIRDREKAAVIVKGGAMLAFAVLMGILISSFMNLSVWEYSRYSIRGGGETGGVGFDYATAWSFPPSEIITFFIPSFMGFGGQTYWGSLPFTDFPQYFGILTFLLAGLALVLNRNRIVWFFTLLAGLSLLASFGKHLPILFGPMFKVLPFFNKFRAPNMIHVLFEFSMVVLAAYGFQAVLDFKEQAGGKKQKNAKIYLWGFGCVLGLIFFVLLSGKGAYLNWAQKAGEYRAAAYDSAVNDGLMAIVFFVVSVPVIIAGLRKKIGPAGFAAIMTVLLIADLWLVDRKFVHFQDKADEKSYFAETPDVTFLKNQQGQFRIMPVEDGRTPNWYMFHLVQGDYGYHAAKLQIYQDLLDAYRMPNAFLMKYLKVVNGQYAFKQKKEVSPDESRLHNSFLRLLNVRYVLSQYPVPDTTLKMVVPPGAQGLPAVFEFPDSLPRVYFPKRALTIQGKDAVLKYMTSGQFDPAETAIIEEKPPFDITASDGNRASIKTWGLHRIEILAETKTPSLLAVSEIFYPAGWKAYVDGKEAKIYKTDYALRSLFLEPGRHDVVMEFKPKMFRIGLLVTLAASGFLILGTIIGAASGRRKRAAPRPEPQP